MELLPTTSYASSFEKDFARLPPAISARAIAAIREVLTNPYRGKKLKGRTNRFALRLGRDYRLVYSVYRREQLIDFEFVGDRKEAYRWMRQE